MNLGEGQELENYLKMDIHQVRFSGWRFSGSCFSVAKENKGSAAGGGLSQGVELKKMGGARGAAGGKQTAGG